MKIYHQLYSYYSTIYSLKSNFKFVSSFPRCIFNKYRDHFTILRKTSCGNFVLVPEYHINQDHSYSNSFIINSSCISKYGRSISYFKLLGKPTTNKETKVCSHLSPIQRNSNIIREEERYYPSEVNRNLSLTGIIIQRENIWTIPNLLCIGRIIISPILCYNVLISYYSVALGLFLVAGFTDLIDGLIARTFPSQASRFGSFLDPLADKILISSLFLTLTYVGCIPLLLTGLIVYRDLAIITAASYVRYKSLPPPFTWARYFDATHATVQLVPTLMSKINTAVQLTLITTSLAAPIFSALAPHLLHALWMITTVTTISSGISYIFSKGTYKILQKVESSKNQ